MMYHDSSRMGWLEMSVRFRPSETWDFGKSCSDRCSSSALIDFLVYKTRTLGVSASDTVEGLRSNMGYKITRRGD